MWSVSPGILHRHVKDPTKVVNEQFHNGASSADPEVLNKTKAQRWSKAWTDREHTREEIKTELRLMHIQARKEDLEPITLEQLDGAMAATSANKAGRVDGRKPRDSKRLPAEARLRLVELINMRERAGTWPRQWFATLGAVVPKPAGGERALGMLPLP
eukprot:5163339-Pyramimonas_sp.AAC.1